MSETQENIGNGSGKTGLTEEQLAIRRTGIGGSEIAALVGLHPFLSPIDVYQRKRGTVAEVSTADMERGTFLEDGTARWWAHRTGAQLRQVGTVRHPEKPLILCTPDRLARMESEEIDLSVKVPGPFSRGWGADGTDEAPEYALLQVQWELIPLGVLYGIRRAAIVAPINGDLQSYPVEAEPEIQGMLTEAAERFWRDHVLPGVPPPPDASEAYGDWLQSRFPVNRGPILTADAEAEKWARKYFAAKRAREVAEEEEQLAKNHLQALIGEAAGIQGDGWGITWKQVKGRQKVDWAAVAAEAKAPNEIIAKHTTTGNGYRRFLATLKEQSHE